MTTFIKRHLLGTPSDSKSLDPDQAQHFVGPDLDPNCLQRLSEDDKGRYKRGKMGLFNMMKFLR